MWLSNTLPLLRMRRLASILNATIFSSLGVTESTAEERKDESFGDTPDSSSDTSSSVDAAELQSLVVVVMSDMVSLRPRGLSKDCRGVEEGDDLEEEGEEREADMAEASWRDVEEAADADEDRGEGMVAWCRLGPVTCISGV
jgi:hypothetical protein